MWTDYNDKSMNNWNINLITYILTIIIMSLSGAAGVLAGHPLDTVKVSYSLIFMYSTFYFFSTLFYKIE